MATYLEKKRQATGLELMPDPSSEDSLFDVIPNPLGQMTGSGFETNWEISLKADTEEQNDLKISVMRWDEEYDADQKAAHKNLAKLNGYLLANKDDEIRKLLQKQPVAEWLNIIFLDETEINDLTNSLIKASPGCRSAVANAVKEGLDSLVNFKTRLESILESISKL